MFRNRNILIATKHQKEKVIAPILEHHLGAYCTVAKDIDTDVLGTFSGEVERKYTALDTARMKCIMALDNTNSDLCIASEGSFYPHPHFPFVHVNEELLVLLDQKNKLQIVAKELNLNTNFNALEIHTWQDLEVFAKQCLFPSHALIVRKAKGDFTNIHKGINSWKQLKSLFNEYLSNYGSMYIETDMRALCNPTRMQVIAQATNNLINKVKSQCPLCKMPGFDIQFIIKGLPCSMCSTPTESTLAYQYKCEHCNYTEEKEYPNQKYFEDPMYCNYCNP